jgi:formylglycine-generating enzyme required for sulfatase activity
MYSRFVSFCLPLAAALFFCVSVASAEVTMDWVTVGDSGNAADTTGFGAVDEDYRISMYEVTNTQYTEFLNAVAATDTYDLYNVHMGTDDFINGAHGGITQSGDAGSYTYSVRTGRGDWPVVWVSFWDVLRFANWLHNGQPTGAQDDTTTEDGAYTITTQGIADNTITVNEEATVFLPSEDEWYKAAYYAGSDSYFDYPAGTDTQTACAAPVPTANTANCGNVVGTVSDVGAYTASASPSGTFDQGGNVYEWNEDIAAIAAKRMVRGGTWENAASLLAAGARSDNPPESELKRLGFRVAALPEPGMGLLGMTSLLVLAALRRRRA